MSDTSINVHMINNSGFIWNTDDWYYLRTTHRLLGSLVGTLPSSPHQEDQNGLPCILLPEEVRLIVENGIGRTVTYPSFTALSNNYNELLRNNEEKTLMYEIKKKYALKKADTISKLVVNAILANGDKNCKEVVELNREICKIKPFDTSSYAMIHLDELCSNALDVPLPELITDLEIIRYKVFKDLWTKGFYLTCGLKFGGDFLVYEGDPLAYHAKYIVHCGNSNKQIMISSSRVSSITNKKMVIAQVDGQSVKYLIYNINDTSQTVYKKPLQFIIQ